MEDYQEYSSDLSDGRCFVDTKVAMWRGSCVCESGICELDMEGRVLGCGALGSWQHIYDLPSLNELPKGVSRACRWRRGPSLDLWDSVSLRSQENEKESSRVWHSWKPNQESRGRSESEVRSKAKESKQMKSGT